MLLSHALCVAVMGAVFGPLSRLVGDGGVLADTWVDVLRCRAWQEPGGNPCKDDDRWACRLTIHPDRRLVWVVQSHRDSHRERLCRLQSSGQVGASIGSHTLVGTLEHQVDCWPVLLLSEAAVSINRR